MSDEHIDDMLRELRDDLMAVRPSPEFAVKVRQQVAAQPARNWFGIWQIATAASVVAVAALAIVLWSSQATKHDAPAPAVIAAQNPPTPLAPVASSTTVAPPVSLAVNQAAPQRATVTQPVRVQQVGSREPEVLVPGDQAAGIRQFMAAVRSGLNASTAQTRADENTGELPPLKLIEIPPITVELLPGTPDGRGGRRNDR